MDNENNTTEVKAIETIDEKCPIIKNPKHKLFIDFYLQSSPRSIKLAYKNAYGQNIADQSALTNGCRLLKNVYVREYFNYFECKVTKDTELSVQWVKDKLKMFSTAKVTDFFEFRGKGKNKKLYVKDWSK